IIEEYAQSKSLKFSYDKGFYKIQNNNLVDLNELIDLLRRNKITISEIAPIKETLEDYFIKVIGKN
ncbi:MAG: hypothetical protein GQ534_11605, partial [Candidatus Delongbacteria bacterium]|nr:hypothetical protein [Candidatus Delongbacteria bacterium]